MIVDQYGNPIKIERKGLTTELASYGAATGSSPEIMPDPDPVLRERGDDATVLAAIAADDQVTMAMQLRKRKVQVKGDYEYSPGQPDKGNSASARAKDLCMILAEDLAPIKLKNVFNGVMDANFYGYSVFELFWRIEGNRLRLTGIVEKPRTWFEFTPKGELLFKENGQKRNVPYGKFLVARHEPTYENPYGLRLLSRCLWPVTFKKAGVDWCMRFLERYGMPWQVVEAPSSYAQDKKKMQELAAMLHSMVQDALAVLPPGAKHTLVKASGSGSGSFLEFINFWNSSISKVLSCQTQSSEITGKHGSLASSKTHYEVLEDVATADEHLVCDAMNDLAIIYATLNASSEHPPVFAFNEAKDYIKQAELDEKRHKAGVRYRPSHYERQGLRSDEFYMVDDKGGDGGGDAPESRKEFSAAIDPHQEGLDLVITDALPKAVAINSSLVEKLSLAVQQSANFNELQDRLVEVAADELDQDEMSELISQLLIGSRLFGQEAVQRETGEDG